MYLDASGARWWVDILEGLLIYTNGIDGEVYKLDWQASKVLQVKKGSAVLATQLGVVEYYYHLNTSSILYKAPRLSWSGCGRSNDGCVLNDGSILLGRMDFSPHHRSGDVVRYSQGRAHVVLKNIAIPNTFVVLEDPSKILISDSYRKKIYICTLYEDPAKPLGKELWCDFRAHPGTPDGGVLGRDGFVYIAMWGGACAMKITQSGEVVGSIALPALNPTSLGQHPTRDTMYVTSATDTLNEGDLLRYPRSGFCLEFSLGGLDG